MAPDDAALYKTYELDEWQGQYGWVEGKYYHILNNMNAPPFRCPLTPLRMGRCIRNYLKNTPGPFLLPSQVNRLVKETLAVIKKRGKAYAKSIAESANSSATD